MPNNCQHPELCMLSETCVPCAICPNAKGKADDRLALTPSSGIPANYIPFNDIPEEVHRAAQTLNSYFERQGMREWQFAAVADRRLVNAMERERNGLHDLHNKNATRSAELLELCQTLRKERDEWKAKYIQQNKDLGCEMMDPNGTIWDYAKKVQTDLASMTEQRDRLAEVLLALRNNESFSIGGAAYEIVEQALQSLNQPTKP